MRIVMTDGEIHDFNLVTKIDTKESKNGTLRLQITYLDTNMKSKKMTFDNHDIFKILMRKPKVVDVAD